MNGTTSIDDLPGTPNIQMEVQDKSNPDMTQSTLDTASMNELVSNIQQASSSGLLDLPNRDVPMNTAPMTQDEQVKPNYVPETKDYIKDFESNENILKKHLKEENKSGTLDVLFQETHLFIILGVLYFFFQMPIINKTMMKHVSFCFFHDGNLNFKGYIYKTVGFVGIFYTICQILQSVQ